MGVETNLEAFGGDGGLQSEPEDSRTEIPSKGSRSGRAAEVVGRSRSMTPRPERQPRRIARDLERRRQRMVRRSAWDSLIEIALQNLEGD